MSVDLMRRTDVLRQVPAEKAIGEAIQAVEALGAHPWLTETVILLERARTCVSEYVDSHLNGAA